jgi:formylglycine-generating enzyme required for sulfatase activity
MSNATRFVSYVLAATAFAIAEVAQADTRYTILEQAPSAAVVWDASLRAQIAASGFPWRVRDNGTGIEMVLIPAGTFTMGCSASNNWGCASDEIPAHQVTLTKAFYLSRTEVTQAQWVGKMGNNPSYFGGDTNCPVERVSWNEIQSFCDATGLRLPSEAEWEYAYRAGTTTAFSGSAGYPNGTSDDSQLGLIAWYSGNSLSRTHAVAGKAANGFGLFDMSGNVFEWCGDWFGSYDSGALLDPVGAASGEFRVVRGGSWLASSFGCRASLRSYDPPDRRLNETGFRVAKTALQSDFLDADGDGLPDYLDNCPSIQNPTQADCDNDGIGDACELAGTGSPYPGAVQWTVASGGNGHWYLGVQAGSAGISWTDARNQALSLGGGLVSLNTPQERLWVFANVANNPALWTTTLGPWVGGYQPEGSSEPGGGWMWVDGTTLYQEFNWGDPPDGNNNCGGVANRMTYWGNYTRGAGDVFHDCADNREIVCWNINFGQHPSYLIEWAESGPPTESDCNANGIPDSCEIASGSVGDCDNDGIPNSCEIAAGEPDCNNNGIPDACDIASGLSRDADQDGSPDECEFDCNHNGLPDDYDIATSASADCNLNGIPDECEDGSVSAVTGSMGRFGNGVIASGTLTAMRASITPVTVTVRARGDLNGTTEFAVVKFANTTVANFFVAGGTDCPSGYDSETYTLSATAWNNMVAASPSGNVAVTVTGSPLVDANQCANGFVEVLVSYKSSRYDCNGDGLSDLCQIASGALPDCNQNGVPDACDISAGTVADIDQNGIPDTCQPDCNANGLPDAYELSRGLAADCNGNGKPDSCDIASGFSTDFDQNGVPDSCQPDCNATGKPDAWEVATGLVPDCNSNGTPDSCDIAAGAPDVDGNGVPDSCQGDCNANGKPDAWEIATGQAPDCNGNGLPDACDLDSGAATDCNGNGTPDSCDIAAGELDDDSDGRIDACELAYGDLDLDGEVTAGDIAFVLLIFGDVNPAFGDLDGDGVVTSGDISIMLLNFGPVPF